MDWWQSIKGANHVPHSINQLASFPQSYLRGVPVNLPSRKKVLETTILDGGVRALSAGR